jgi:hypothetical protein
MLKALIVPRRSQIASFSPTIADQYLHASGCLMTVRRDCWWKRDAQGAEWASENGYRRLSSKLSFWCEQGCWPAKPRSDRMSVGE